MSAVRRVCRSCRRRAYESAALTTRCSCSKYSRYWYFSANTTSVVGGHLAPLAYSHFRMSQLSSCQLTNSPPQNRWFGRGTHGLSCHPVTVARFAQQWFERLMALPYGVGACCPLVAAEANLVLHSLKTAPGIGAAARKFLSEQLRDVKIKAASTRVRLAVGAILHICRSSSLAHSQDTAPTFVCARCPLLPSDI